MAIFGNLTEFPFLEVLKMLERKSGVLRFLQLRPYASVELHLHRGTLQALHVDGVPILDAGIARSYLLEISAKRMGEFEFGTSSHVVPNPLGIVVTDAVLGIGASEELFAVAREWLPDTKTRFNAADGAPPQSNHLDADLRRVWPSIHPLLMRGSSAEEIAAQLGLSEETVQHALYKLRAIGAIRPARRIEETQTGPATFGRATTTTNPSASPSPAVSTRPTAKPTLISRLLGALSFARRSS